MIEPRYILICEDCSEIVGAYDTVEDGESDALTIAQDEEQTVYLYRLVAETTVSYSIEPVDIATRGTHE